MYTLWVFGFELNPYDKYEANKTIDGTLCTITWYVDDVKISLVNKDVVTKVINDMKRTFGKLTVNHGKKHRLLGMNISINVDKTVSINTSSYINEILEAFPEKVNTGATSPANRNIFNRKPKILQSK